MTKFQNRYRSESTRHLLWNYAWPADYFITLCLNPRRYLLGDIVSGKMQLTEIGELAEREWNKTLEMRKDMNLSMGPFVVMPDHFHAMISIGKNSFNLGAPDVDILKNPAKAKKTLEEYRNRFGPQRKNLCSIIRGFKTAVKCYALKNGIEFSWQDLYHDRIIRNKDEYNRIAVYIRNNVKNWN